MNITTFYTFGSFAKEGAFLPEKLESDADFLVAVSLLLRRLENVVFFVERPPSFNSYYAWRVQREEADFVTMRKVADRWPFLGDLDADPTYIGLKNGDIKPITFEEARELYDALEPVR